MSKPILWIVIPCYNEERVLPITAPMFLKKINDLAAAGLVSEKSRVLFVNDGSRDATWSLIQKFASEDEHFIGISQSRNRGHQNAVLAGLMEALHSGSCDINGRTPWKERVGHAREIGVVFGQRSQLWWDVPVDDSFELIRDIYRVDKAQYMDTRDELVALLGLEDILMTPARSLSLGQRMRCELAASLLHRPRILFLDEPTIGLDAVSKLAVRQFIRRINREEGTTVILTTHDMQDIEALARRIILIGRGRILLDGGLDEIRRHGGDTKTITFEYRGEVPSLCDGMDMLESREGRLAVRLNGDRCGTAQAIAHISSQVELLDLSVASPGAEELVAALYREYSI